VEADGELVAKALQGSDEALARLFDRHWTTAWRAAHAVTNQRDLADDAAQNAFVQAIRALERFDQERSFAPWIARIAVNCARDLLRSQARHHSAPSPDGAALDPARDQSLALLDGLARLSPEHREVVVLHHVLGFQLSEAAEVLALPPGTVASRLSRALAQLRQTMEADQHV